MNDPQIYIDFDQEQVDRITTANDQEKEYFAVVEEIAQDAHDTPEEQEESITIDLSGYDPKLDPNSPLFDMAAYKAAIAKAGGLEVITAGVKQRITELQQRIVDQTIRINPDLMNDALKEVSKTVSAAIANIFAFTKSPEYRALKENLDAISEYIKNHQAEIQFISEQFKEIEELSPFISMVIDDMKQDPAFQNLSLDDILRDIAPNGTPQTSFAAEILKQARQRQLDILSAQDVVEEIETAKEQLPQIIGKPAEIINYPLDKPNSIIWNLISSADPNGQLKLQIDTSRRGRNQDSVILFSLLFEEPQNGLKITKNLTQFDKRVYIACGSLFNGGNNIVSASQIYRAMGNSKRPSPDDIKKINDSLTKMGAARVYIDNTQEAKNTKYPHFKYDAPLLPFERITAYINNNLVKDSAIHFYREPPLITFAKQRNQITTVSRQLLESPISKTESNLRIEDYLIERIGRMRSGKGTTSRKILYSTLFEKCEITTAKQKQRTPEKIRRYLTHYKKTGWIIDFKEESDGISIIL